MKMIFLFYLLLGFTAVLGISNHDTVLGSQIFEEKLNYPDGDLPAEWGSEGVPATIQNGRLFVYADIREPRVATVWLDREFSGNLQVEYDVHVVSSEEIANNLNFFFLYSDPDGRNLRETKKEREDGLYARYHKLKGYIFTHLANGTVSPARFRLRQNPRFELLHEWYGYECKTATTYRIKVVKMDKNIQYWVDGNLIIDFELKEGLSEKGILEYWDFVPIEPRFGGTIWWLHNWNIR
ncbi:MAG: DUF6250 domain-containing protein [Cyclobacteriaceae bacterium]